MLKYHYPYYKKFILLFCLLSKLFITFFFKALAFFSSLRCLSKLFHSLIDYAVNVPPPSNKKHKLKKDKSLIVEHDIFFCKIIPYSVYFGLGEDFKLTMELSKKVQYSHNQSIKNGLNEAILHI